MRLGDVSGGSERRRRLRLPRPRLPGQGVDRPGLSRLGTAWTAAGIAALALVLRVITAAEPFRTQDETRWLLRSSSFYDALRTLDLGRASALQGRDAPAVEGYESTMPGVVTMWVGAVARGVWSMGRALGAWAAGDGTFADEPSGMTAAQVAMAVTTAALVGLVTALVASWAGRKAAVIAGLLVATEPFLVAHGAVLHTDELMALFGVGSLVATALVLGVPEPTRWAGRPTMAALAGLLWAGAVLTKTTALVFLVSVGLLALWAAARPVAGGDGGDGGDEDDGGEDRRRGLAGRRSRLVAGAAPLLRPGGWWLGSAFVAFVAAYPALWVAPGRELRAVWRSVVLGSQGHQQFFLGDVTDTPGPAYYLVALPLRMTPWLLAGLAAAITVGLVGRLRGFGGALAVMTLPALVAMSFASKQFDRYGVVHLMLAAVLVGVAAPIAVDWLRARWETSAAGRVRRRVAAVAAGLGVVMLALHSWLVAPWGLAYFNPLLGGSSTGEDALLVGWGEGLERAGTLVEQREPGRCDEIVVAVMLLPGAVDCGRQVLVQQGHEADYVLLYVSQRQRLTGEQLAAVVEDRELVDEVRIRGITYVEIYH